MWWTIFRAWAHTGNNFLRKKFPQMLIGFFKAGCHLYYTCILLIILRKRKKNSWNAWRKIPNSPRTNIIIDILIYIYVIYVFTPSLRTSRIRQLTKNQYYHWYIDIYICDICIYPISPHKQDTTQGQFITMELNRFKFRTFLLPDQLSYQC